MNWKFRFIISALFIAMISGSRVSAVETVVADFDSGANPVNWGPNVSTYGVSNDSNTALGSAAYSASVYHSPAEGYSLKIEWSGINAADEYGGGVITDDTNSSRDLSGYSAISFWIYTPNANTSLSFGLMTTDYISGYVQLQDYIVTDENTWQNVIVPIAAFKRNNPDLDIARIKEIKWLSEYSRSNDASGLIYVDDVSLCTFSHTPAGTKIFAGRNLGAFGDADLPGDTIGDTDNWRGATSNESSLTVAPVYGASWISTPLSRVTNSADSTTYFAYQIRNNGNSADKITLSTEAVSGPQDWPVTLYWDKDRSGSFTDGDVECRDTIGLLPDSTHYFLIGVRVPSNAVSGSTATFRVTARTNNGSGVNDAWPSSTDNDTITDDFALLFDYEATYEITPGETPAPSISILKEPESSIVITEDTDLVFQVEVNDPTSKDVTVSFIKSMDSSTATDTHPVALSGGNIYTATVTVTGTCSLTYSWRAVNGDGYITQTTSRTIIVNKELTATGFTFGTVSLDDTNAYGGTSSIYIPEGALDSAINLKFLRKDRSDAEIKPAGQPAASTLPSVPYEFGPDGTTFKKPATITLQYLDSDNNKLEDTSGKDERTMRIFWWDGREWRLVGGDVDTAKKTVTAQIMHFSLYATFPINMLSDEDYRPKERIITPAGSRGKNDYAQFGVTNDFTINIYDINGAKVRTLTDSNIWAGEDDDGNMVESGVYIYQIKAAGKTVSGTILVAK